MGKSYAALLVAMLISVCGMAQIRVVDTIHWPTHKDGELSGELDALNPPSVLALEYFRNVNLPAGANNLLGHFLEVAEEMVPEDERAGFYGISLPESYQLQASVSGASSSSASGYVRFLPFRRGENDGEIYRVTHFVLDLFPCNSVGSLGSRVQFSSSSKLAEGEWSKIAIVKDGVYEITYKWLKDNGVLSSPIVSDKIALFGFGAGMLPQLVGAPSPDDLPEIPIKINDGGDGIFGEGDSFLFYAQSPHKWVYVDSLKEFNYQHHAYTDTASYFLTITSQKGRRIEQISQHEEDVDESTSYYDHNISHKRELRSLINSGRGYVGEHFDLTKQYEYSYDISGVEPGTKVGIKCDLLSRSPVTSSFSLYANGNSVGKIDIPSVTMDYRMDYAKYGYFIGAFDAHGSDELKLQVKYHKGTNISQGWLQQFFIHFRRRLSLSDHPLLFRDAKTVGKPRVRYHLSSNGVDAPQVWEVTDIHQVHQLPLSRLSDTEYTFVADGDLLREFVAFNKGQVDIPLWKGKVRNQNLHGMMTPVEYLIFAPEFLIPQAERLADFHISNSGLKVKVVSIDHVYNEFSSGMQDISAIRNFIKMLYDRFPQEQGLKYVLFVGGASFDYKNVLNKNSNLLPTYEHNNLVHPIVSYATDDFFGYLNDGEGDLHNSDKDIIDIGIGRFPVMTLEEAEIVVDKVINYMTPSFEVMGDWRNMVAFVADDEEGGGYVKYAETLVGLFQEYLPDFNVEKIYLDAYPKVTLANGQRFPEANNAINLRVERGALFVNYTGHGGETGWALERVLDNHDINSWTNYSHLPIFVTATCEFSRYDDATLVSAGEQVILSKKGGGIALYSTTRQTYSNQNFSTNNSFYRNILSQKGKLRLGDYVRLSKAENPSGNTKRFILLGDPALRLAFPENRVMLTSINDHDIAYFSDTLKALDLVKVAGIVADVEGNLMSEFDGILYVTIYDKAENVQTMGQGQSSPVMDFSVQKNVLYKGQIKVEKGGFSFSFIVPKDIDYRYGRGKVSFYATDGSQDAIGYSDAVVIGGSGNNIEVESTPPQVELYINDTLFVDGGLSGVNPILFATIKSSSAINTVGSGLGHDIMAYIDNRDKIYLLNDYYRADVDTYQQGTIVYPFFDVPEGDHTLYLKVWDVHNNSTLMSCNFTVVNRDRLEIQRLYNYPNPIANGTNFVFEHNFRDEVMKLSLNVYDMSGRKVHTYHSEMNTGKSFVSPPIYWDAFSVEGRPLAKGTYFYTLDVVTEEGYRAQKKNKLIIVGN